MCADRFKPSFSPGFIAIVVFKLVGEINIFGVKKSADSSYLVDSASEVS